MFSDIAFHSQKTKIFEATCYIILFFGSPAQGDGSSVKKLCEEVGKNFKPRLGRPRGRPARQARQARQASRQASKPQGTKPQPQCKAQKSLEAGLGDKPRAWLAGRTKAYK